MPVSPKLLLRQGSLRDGCKADEAGASQTRFRSQAGAWERGELSAQIVVLLDIERQQLQDS